MAARGNPGGPTGGAGGGYPRPPPPPQAAAAGNGSQGNNGAPPPPPPSAANEATNHLSAGFGGYGSPQVSTVTIGFCDQRPSGGLRSLNPARPLKQESGYSDQVVAKASVNAKTKTFQYVCIFLKLLRVLRSGLEIIID